MEKKSNEVDQKRAYGYLRSDNRVIGGAFHEMYEKTVSESTLDKKTHELVYIAYLAAMKEYSGLEFHVKGLKKMGVSRKDIESAILCGLAPVGITLSHAYQAAMNAYDDQ